MRLSRKNLFPIHPEAGSDRASGIVMRDVVLSRGGRRVLKHINLSLTERRIALVGANGSGKSSLVRLINGLLTPDAGSVEVCGQAVTDIGRAMPRLVGFLFQNPDHQIIFPTVAEEIGYGLRQLGVTRREAAARALAVLQENNCSDWAERPVSSLSEGQKQLVCILAVLVMAPRILVLDEPFASLDLATRMSFLARIDALDQQVILISHDLEAVAHYDRAVWLDGGRVVGDGPPAEVLPRYRALALERAGVLTPERL